MMKCFLSKSKNGQQLVTNLLKIIKALKKRVIIIYTYNYIIEERIEETSRDRIMRLE